MLLRDKLLAAGLVSDEDVKAAEKREAEEKKALKERSRKERQETAFIRKTLRQSALEEEEMLEEMRKQAEEASQKHK